jgi:hypothetical protein
MMLTRATRGGLWSPSLQVSSAKCRRAFDLERELLQLVNCFEWGGSALDKPVVLCEDPLDWENFAQATGIGEKFLMKAVDRR